MGEVRVGAEDGVGAGVGLKLFQRKVINSALFGLE